MTSNYIMDTGHLVTDNTDTQLAAGNMANGGTAFTLKNMKITFNSSQNQDATPPVGQFAEPVVNVVSFEPLQVNINGNVKSSDATDMAFLFQMVRLTRTRGYKIMYYSDAADTTQLLTMMANGHINTGGAYSTEETTYPHIHVFFNDVQMSQNATTNLISFSLKGIITKDES